MSDTYLYNTLYTNYAFSKLANNLANPSLAYSPYNLILVKIGTGDNSVDLDKLSLSKAVATLNVTNVKASSSSITFTCEIPEDIKGVEITEIGLFDVIDGEEKLFSYSRVQTVKPEDIDYKLVIELNITLRTINFYPEKIRLYVNEYEYTNQTILRNLETMFLYIEENIERIIDFNSMEVGKNLPQSYYQKELEIGDIAYGYFFSSKYFNLLNLFGKKLRNSFFIKYADFLSYSIKDMATEGAYLNVYNNNIKSYGDQIQFNGVATLSFTAKLGTFTDSVMILNKVEETTSARKHFTLAITDSNTLAFTIYGDQGNYTFTCILTNAEIASCTDNYNNYTITYNGNVGNPSCEFYLNGKLKSILEVSNALVNQPDGASIPLKNYEEGSSVNNIYLKSIVFLNKYITEEEAHNLYIAQKERNV